MPLGNHVNDNSVPSELLELSVSNWSVRWPNPADLSFDYRRLVEAGIASINPTSADVEEESLKALNPRIAIIGAGIAGLTVARELYRCGFTNVHLYEADGRTGGRLLTLYHNDREAPDAENTSPPNEMAAMRFPFFNRFGVDGQPLEDYRQAKSLLSYYANIFGIYATDFPNPGSKFADTGIYLYDGTGFENEKPPEWRGKPFMHVWTKNASTPPLDIFRKIKQKRDSFSSNFKRSVTLEPTRGYGSGHWSSRWNEVLLHYKDVSFREFVKTPAKTSNFGVNGDCGGLGLNDEESRIFYMIGVGDGSWGAFYDISMLYPMRTSDFAFSSGLRLVHGRYTETSKKKGKPVTYSPGSYCYSNTLRDSLGVPIERPQYIGAKSFSDGMLFLPVIRKNPDGTDVILPSLYEAATSYKKESGVDIQLLLNTKVTEIKKEDVGGKPEITLTSRWQHLSMAGGGFEFTRKYDCIITTGHLELPCFRPAFGYNEGQWPNFVAICGLILGFCSVFGARFRRFPVIRAQFGC